MTGDGDVSRGALAGEVRSSSGLIANEWRRRLSATPWQAVLAADVHDEIGERYLPTLVEMVARQIERPSAELAAVYRDELCRYELQLQSAADQRAATEEPVKAVDLIAAQRAAFESTMADPQRTLAAALLDQLNGPLLIEPDTRVSILLLGDCLMNEIRCFLADKARRANVAVDGYHLYFSGALSVPFETISARYLLDQKRVDAVSLSPFTFDGLPLFRELLIRAETSSPDEKSVDSALKVVHAIIEDIRSLIDAPILLHNACGAPVGRDRQQLTSLPPLTRRGHAVIDMLNSELARRAANWGGVIVVDESRVARRFGLRFLSEAAIPGEPISGALFHTSRLGRELAEVYWDFLDSHRRLGHIRVLVVDLDGTLWSGVMAEGKVDHFVERQVLLRDLARLGIVLVALSKGSAESLRWDELRIDQRDFAVIHRSWDSKETGFQLMLRELNVRPEHVGVIDDSPTERALLTAAFPGLAAFDAGDPRTWRWLALLHAATRGRATKEARSRADRYRASQERSHFVARASGLDQRMRQLGLTITFGRMTIAELPRALELLRRTNQFNTTGLVPTRSRLLRLTQPGGPDDAFVAQLKDRFGDFGLVAVVIVRRADPSIESFVMSCRAMGYGVEQIVLDLVISKFGVPLGARLLHTRLNEPCHGLYAWAGFTEDQPGHWRLAARKAVTLPTWFDVHDTGENPLDNG